MKKIALIVIALLGIAFTSFGQDKGKTFLTGEYWWEPTYGADDTVSNFDTLYYTQVYLNKAEPVKYNVYVSLDKVAGTPKGTIQLQGKVFSSDSWTNITTVTWAGTVDTTFSYTQTSTAQYYRYFRVYHDFNGTATGRYKILQTKFKFWDR